MMEKGQGAKSQRTDLPETDLPLTLVLDPGVDLVVKLDGDRVADRTVAITDDVLDEGGAGRWIWTRTDASGSARTRGLVADRGYLVWIRAAGASDSSTASAEGVKGGTPTPELRLSLRAGAAIRGKLKGVTRWTTRVGSRSSAFSRPPPPRRARSRGNVAGSGRSWIPRATDSYASPVALRTAAIPPRPVASASVAAHNQRRRSSSVGPSSGYFSRMAATSVMPAADRAFGWQTLFLHRLSPSFSGIAVSMRAPSAYQGRPPSHAVVTQIPDARRHLVRYYGASRHGRRAAVRAKNGSADALAVAGTPAAPAGPDPVTPVEPGSPEAPRARRGRRCRSRSSKWIRWSAPGAEASEGDRIDHGPGGDRPDPRSSGEVGARVANRGAGAAGVRMKAHVARFARSSRP